MSGFCYTSPPRGNQVGDLLPARHMGLAQLAFDGCRRLSMILTEPFIVRLTFSRDLEGSILKVHVIFCAG